MAIFNRRRFYIVASVQILIISFFFFFTKMLRPYGIILGFAYLYLSFVSFLLAFEEKKEVQTLLAVFEKPLKVLIGLFREEIARQIMTSAMVLVLFLVPFLFGSIVAFQALQDRIGFVWVVVYGLLVLLSIWFSSERFERLFNRWRVEPLAEYKCGYFKLVIEAFYLVSIVVSTVLAFVTDTSILGAVIKNILLPAFITYIAWQRLHRAYHEIHGRTKNLKQRGELQ